MSPTLTATATVDVLKVGAATRVHALAGSIAKSLREHPACALQCIGAGALNQAVKACAVARTFVRDDGLALVLVPDFIDVDLGAASQSDREVVSGLQLTVRRTALGLA